MNTHSSIHPTTGTRSTPGLPFEWPEGLPCHFQAVAVFGTRGCRQIREVIVDIRLISSTDLVLQSSLARFLPPNFTLVLGARQYGMGCSVYRRRGDRIHCRLIRPENPAMIAYLSTVTRPAKTLSELAHPLFPRPRQERRLI